MWSFVQCASNTLICTNSYYMGWCQFVCRQHQFAIRATLLSTETLKSRNIYLDAAMQFMRMTAEVMYKLLHQGLPYDL